MAIRNKLFDLGMMSCEKTSIKSIGVGNLAYGGYREVGCGDVSNQNI
jgi:hypothetical protein